jgi:hypothetical protein
MKFFFFNYLLALKAGLHFMGFFFDKVTIYNILGLLLGTSCDICGGNANYEK